jgi:DNA-binding response OmpR family regulator
MVVEDSPDILSVLRRGLQRRGFEVIPCPDGETALRSFGRETPDIVVLDLLLPDTDGIDLCYQLQEIRETPVIMLTSLDSVNDRVEGLRAGADDYMVKPFAMEELVARIEAVLRRKPATPTELTYDAMTVDVGGHQVLLSGVPVAVTPKEFALIATLARHPQRVFTRETLTSLLWPGEDEVEDNVLDVHVANLRQKLESNGGRRLIQTVRGVGFVLR